MADGDIRTAKQLGITSVPAETRFVHKYVLRDDDQAIPTIDAVQKKWSLEWVPLEGGTA